MNFAGHQPQQKPPKLTPAEKRAGKLHMERVASLGCVICGCWPVEVHHIICGRYSQKKPPDTETIPLCIPHHRIGPEAIHNGKRSWVEKYGPDTDYLPVVEKLLT